MVSSMIKAILFDLDGTLLDTESLSDKALLMALAALLQASSSSSLSSSSSSLSTRNENKIPTCLPWELKQKILGLRGAEWTPIALDYARDHWDVVFQDPDPTVLWKEWEDALNGMCEEVVGCPGATELVELLAHQGYPMAIATSSRYAAVERKRKNHARIFQHMKAIVAGDDPSVVQGKPAPDIYLEAARQLQVDPQQCLVFEDALPGVRAGKAAGCFVIAIPDKRFSEQEKQVFRDEADMVLDDLWQFDGESFGINVDMNKYFQK